MPPTPNDLETYRARLTGHCYRMLGGASEAEDAVQETMVRAWRAIDGFEERAALGTWLHRIATNVCLDLLAKDARRTRPYALGPAMSLDRPDARQRDATEWVEPIADALVLPSDADPAERALSKESVRLAFVAALQLLPPKQRAALLLTEVLGFSMQETADTLETTQPAIQSALQRARETLSRNDASARELDRLKAPLPPPKAALLDSFLHAFERYDVSAIADLLRADATQNMPPYVMWLDGARDIAAWMSGPGAACRGSRLVPIALSGVRGFAQYRRSEATPRGGPERGHSAWALIALDVEDDRIASLTYFLDVERLFPRFALPLTLAPGVPLPVI
ncbi:MAG: RNA polymerase subunit sigma-70 [Deltaproteobacteria bacterium]|nr:RNA polymerase subunit sigma-70 [Deltaproteobacteria bacterium]